MEDPAIAGDGAPWPGQRARRVQGDGLSREHELISAGVGDAGIRVVAQVGFGHHRVGVAHRAIGGGKGDVEVLVVITVAVAAGVGKGEAGGDALSFQQVQFVTAIECQQMDSQAYEFRTGPVVRHVTDFLERLAA